MNPDLQPLFVKMLEWVGWTEITQSRHDPDRYFGVEPEWGRTEIPPLTLDLVHEWVFKLPDSQCDTFLAHLEDICGVTGAQTEAERSAAIFRTVNASAEQRLVALGRTLFGEGA